MQSDNLLAAIERFKYLNRIYSHSPGRHGTREQHRLFREAQTELWRLTQVIVGLTQPDLQLELDTVRRAIAAQLDCAIKTPALGAGVRTTRAYKPLHWQDFQVTPELTADPYIGGSAVFFCDLKKLKELLRAQSTALRSALA